MPRVERSYESMRGASKEIMPGSEVPHAGGYVSPEIMIVNDSEILRDMFLSVVRVSLI